MTKESEDLIKRILEIRRLVFLSHGDEDSVFILLTDIIEFLKGVQPDKPPTVIEKDRPVIDTLKDAVDKMIGSGENEVLITIRRDGRRGY